MDELVSVIVPVYKVEQFLMRCYNSIDKQTYSNLEIILVDDGSPDNCGKMCDEIAEKDCRVKVIHKINEGLGIARNTGLDAATGEYVVFIDSDDFVSETFVEKMYRAISQEGADTCTCGIIKYYTPEYQIVNRLCTDSMIYTGDSIKNDLMLSMIGSAPEKGAVSTTPMSVWHQMYSMKIIKDNNIRFHSEREFISEDIIFQIDYFSKAECVVKISETLYYYYCSQVGSLSTKYRKNRYDEEVKLAKELYRKLHEVLPVEKYEVVLQGMFLGRARTCLMMEYVHKNDENFKQIVNDPYLSIILDRYPIDRCNIELKIFNYCLKYRWSNVIKLLLYARKMKKK
ncbi:glycosyltransferase family 2 protein [Enterococcus faecium]|uniref:glycosyltransferase family 2 protein n=1 Tax=Enterococcus faecium TaxID=1352 RepID=UPI0018834B00|nr:glycosyltransferase family 2 protein [Enterococcus faecium]EME5381313.1 glycosyltransferase family 2 protein [Enterococcus faecium]MBE9871853.1 glycosyltransferase family 2 protein [Enterococcus faecium]MDK4437928.1 glycosyltransferase [Enterococcus faecium]HBL8370098.1 glycosyltransferase family 2 protein [Enterococcus faecium]